MGPGAKACIGALPAAFLATDFDFAFDIDFAMADDLTIDGRFEGDDLGFDLDPVARELLGGMTGVRAGC